MNKPVCILYTVIFVCAITSAVSDVLHPLLTKSRRTKNIQLQYPSASSSSIRSLQEEEGVLTEEEFAEPSDPSSTATIATTGLGSVCADTSGYSDQWGGTCADFEDNEGWCAGYGSMGQPGATPNENCCVCGKGAVAEDTESSISSTAAPTTSNPTLSPLATVTTSNPTPSPLAAVNTSNPTPSPTPPPSEMVAVTTQSPTTLGFGSGFGASSWPTAEEPCPEEAAAVEEACMSSMDLDNLDSYLACSLCGVEAMGEDLFNFDDFCSKWTLCVEEHCSEECKVPMNAYQNCNSMGMHFDCDIGSDEEGSGSGEDSPSATVPSPSAVAVPATQSPQGSFGSISGSGFGSSSWPTVEEPCPEEATAIEKCMPMDLNNLDSYLACSMCGLEAMGEDIFSFNVDEYCSKWTPCIEEKCPDECKVPLSEYQKCSSMGSLDCGVGSSEASLTATGKSIATLIILAVVGAMFV